MKKTPLTFLLIFWGSILYAQGKLSTGDSLTNESVPVLFRNDTLFSIFTSPLGITPKERVLLIQSRLNKIADTATDFKVADLTIKDSVRASYFILYKNDVLLTVTPADGLANNTDAAQLAIAYKKIISEKLLQVFAFNKPSRVARSLGEAVLTIIILIVFIWLVNKGTRLLIYEYLLKKETKPFYFRKYELLSSLQVKKFVTRFIIIVKCVFIILMIYFSLPVLFSLFPWTQSIAHKLISFIVHPVVSIYNSVTGYLPNLFTIIIIFLFTRFVISLIKYFVIEIEKGNLSLPGFYSDWAQPTFNIIKTLLYVLMFIAVFPYLPGSDSKIFQGVSVFLGILLSVGSSSAISNVVAGIVITYMRPFKLGDRVKIGDVTGDVIEKNLLITRVRTIKNEEITIPNSAILSGGTINYSACAMDKGLILHTTITIGYDVPWRQVHDLLINAALITENILQEPVPFVLQTSLDDSYVSYQLNAYTRISSGMSAIYSKLHQNIQDEFNKAGVEIMSPAYHAIRDGNTVTIPSEQRPAGYEPDAFNISIKNK